MGLVWEAEECGGGNQPLTEGQTGLEGKVGGGGS